MIQNDLFEGAGCGDDALSALRLAFHDAMGFSIHGGKGGGADGSILIFNETENAFLFQETGLSAGDFIHLAAAVGTANCRGAPSLKFYYGRPPPVAPGPDNTVPRPTDNVTSIIEEIRRRWLHGTPFDSTVDIFDTQIFLEVLLKGTLLAGNQSRIGEALSPIRGEMRIQSDFLPARDPRTACLWQDMINNQAHATRTFKAAMTKLQLLGQNVTELIDCSEVIPSAAPFNSHIKYPA